MMIESNTPPSGSLDPEPRSCPENTGRESDQIQALPALLRLGEILAPTDGSANSAAALKHALALAEHFHADLVLLHVVEPPVAYADMVYTSRFTPEQDAIITNQIADRVRELLGLSDQEKEKLRRHTLLEHGVPWQVILDTARARNSGLIVLSTHGRTGFAHALLGSTAEKVIRNAPCPVLVVRS